MSRPSRSATSFGLAAIAVVALAAFAALRPRAPTIGAAPDPGARGGEPGPTGNGGPPELRLLVPAYFYPAGPSLDEWDRLLRAAARAPITVVVNPGSGPGQAADPNYLAVIERAGKQGVVAIGYISTSYARRPLDEVLADVETWVRLYPEIRGVFLDSQADGVEHLAYYDQIRKLVAEKIPGAVVITNPGASCAEEYFMRPVTDTACVFEAPEGFGHFRLPAWAALYPPRRFAALPYRVTGPEAMKEAVAQAARGRIGAIYVTDADGANPWSRLPRYWEAEVEAVHRVNQRQAP